MKPFTIVIDTGCDLPQEYIKQHDIKVMPITLTLDDKDYTGENWEKISGSDFYTALKNGSTAKTALINPEAFIDSFTQHAKQGEDVLYIILSSGLSGTYQSSQIALGQVKEEYPDSNIYPVDSLGATSINGLMAMLAVKKREEGLSAAETAAWLEEKKHNLFGIVTVDDLMYLHRGGRLSKLSAIGGSILSIKPIISIQPDGTLALTGKVRGRMAAFKQIVGQMQKSINPDTTLDTVIIPHTDCEEDANKLAEMIKEAVKVKEVIVMMMGPIIGAHVGPGAVAAVFEADVTREESRK